MWPHPTHGDRGLKQIESTLPEDDSTLVIALLVNSFLFFGVFFVGFLREKYSKGITLYFLILKKIPALRPHPTPRDNGLNLL